MNPLAIADRGDCDNPTGHGASSSSGKRPNADLLAEIERLRLLLSHAANRGSADPVFCGTCRDIAKEAGR